MGSLWSRDNNFCKFSVSLQVPIFNIPVAGNGSGQKEKKCNFLENVAIFKFKTLLSKKVRIN